MTAIALPRITVPTLNVTFTLPKDLEWRARDRLNYRYIPPTRAEVEFLQGLAKVGATPFEPKAVLEYKRKMLRKHRENFLKRISTKKHERVAWRTCRIGIYRDPIPAEILELAIKIQDETPYAAEIRVEHLGTRDYERMYEEYMRTYDPFLIVRRDSRDSNAPWHHVAVWDEADFKG